MDKYLLENKLFEETINGKDYYLYLVKDTETNKHYKKIYRDVETEQILLEYFCNHGEENE